MQRDELRVQLRRRSEWEALELGRAMFRRWSRSVYRVWVPTYAMVVALVVVATWPWPGLAPFVLWWLKPLFDRVLLFVYGQHVFGRTASLGDFWRALPGLLRRSGLIYALTLGRLSVSRSLLLPIWQLEGQRGRAARVRARLIGRRPFSYAAWLTIVCALVNVTLIASQALLLWFLTPTRVGIDDLLNANLWIFELPSRGLVLLLVAFMAVAHSIVEPLYVASGFTLYLNRRSDLEAWDVELGFRSLAERLAGTRVRPRGGGVAASIVLVLFLTASASTQRQSSPDGSAPVAAAGGSTILPAHESKGVIRDVLADPIFGVEREVRQWQPKKRTGAGDLPEWVKWLGKQVERLAGVARLALWPAGAALVAWLVVLWQRQQMDRIDSYQPVPDIVFGMDVRPESLPADVPGHARELVARGEITAALGLLYRAALSALIHRGGVRLAAGDTEGECLRRAATVLGAPSLEYFAGLVGCWQLAAYARRPPGDVQALTMCDEWARHFSAWSRPA